MSTSYAEQHSNSQEASITHALEASELCDVLYMCDFPPSNYRGGTVTMSRLLAGYPAERLTVLSGSHEYSIAPNEGRLWCRHLIFPTTSQTGRWGLGRLKSVLDWILMPSLVLAAVWMVKRRRIRAILTIAHGYFFIAASLVSRLAGVPLLLIVHDDWVTTTQKTSFILRFFAAWLFRKSTHSATIVYAVSPGMKSFLKERFDVESELLMPAASGDASFASDSVKEDLDGDRPLRIVYAGTLSPSVDDAFDLLVELVKSERLRELAVNDWELHLYVLATPEQANAKGWNDPRITFHGWINQAQMRPALAQADILFLPYSFREDQRFATVSAFPSKASDYLQAARPILVFAPSYSSVVKYAREYECAEVVDQPDRELLARAIARISSSADHRARLARNAWRAFTLNHDLARQRADLYRLLNKLA